jgi:dTDP-D-glucose 4,6-dehydratase
MSKEIEIEEEESMVDVLKRLTEMNKVEYANAPGTLEEAISRLARAEFLLEDLARGAELAEITGNKHLTTVFRVAAEEYLKDKLVVKEEEEEEAE